LSPAVPPAGRGLRRAVAARQPARLARPPAVVIPYKKTPRTHLCGGTRPRPAHRNRRDPPSWSPRF